MYSRGNKQLINIEPRSITPVADISFKTWVYLACSNHAIYLKWRALLRDTRKIDYRAHVSRARVQFTSDPDQYVLIIYWDSWFTYLNANIQSELNQSIYNVAYQRCILSHNVTDLCRLRRYSVHENYMSLRQDSLVSLLPAIRILSNGCEKLFKVVLSASYMCTHLIERINSRTSIVYRPLRTNLPIQE